jgi:RNA polymerase sigma factor (sigma-70 family)
MVAAGTEILTDAELVGRFAEHRDASAFEVLVWRHGPMVWATCRRILRQHHDIEDAFQATFLALARTAGSIGTRRATGGWLHRVAVNAALKLKAKRTTELTVEVAVRSAGALDGDELAGAVDEELNRLPERSRAAFVLCCLEGLTSAEAARELGCPVGTVDSRLHAARTRLRARLTRRGFGPAALAGLVVVGAPPAATLAAAVGSGSGVAPRQAVAELAQHVTRAVTHGSLLVKTGIGAVLVLVLVGSVLALGGAREREVPAPTQVQQPVAPPGLGPAAPAVPTTVWGKSEKGLQAGLRCPAGKRVLKYGESVELELIVRNVARHPIAFEYLPWENSTSGYVALTGVPERGELRLSWLTVINGVMGRTPVLLAADQELVRGRVTLVHGPVGPVPAGARQPIGLPSGTYRVLVDPVGAGFSDRFSQPGAGAEEFPHLSTGVLNLILPAAQVRAAPVPPGAGRGEGRIAVWRSGHPLSVRPGTKETAELVRGFEGKRGELRLGPDGLSALVYIANRQTIRPSEPENRDRVFIRALDGDGTEAQAQEIKLEGVSPCAAFWGADGRTVYGHGLIVPNGADPAPAPDLTTDFINWVFDLRTRKVERLKLPGNVSIVDRSADGKSFLVLRYDKPTGVPGEYRLGVLPAAGGAFVALTRAGEATPGDFRFSPDGQFALGTVYRSEDGDGDLVPEPVVFDLKSLERTPVTVPKDARVCGSCWSPDGSRIAFAWEPESARSRRRQEMNRPAVGGGQKYELTITVARPDGSEARDIHTESEYWYGSIDWR